MRESIELCSSPCCDSAVSVDMLDDESKLDPNIEVSLGHRIQ